MLLIEGPDSVGKTRLAAELVNALASRGCPVRADKFGLPESTRMLAECKDRVSQWTVCDRSWVSEVAYGRTIRGTPRISTREAYACQEMFKRAGGLTVLVTATPSRYAAIMEELYDASREAFTKEECLLVNEAYRRMVHDGEMDGYEVDVDIHVELDHSSPWPSSDESLVRRISDAYVSAQRAVDRLRNCDAAEVGHDHWAATRGRRED